MYDCKVTLFTVPQAWHFCSLVRLASNVIVFDAWPLTNGKIANPAQVLRKTLPFYLSN